MIATVVTFLILLIIFNVIQWWIIEETSESLEEKTLKDMAERLLHELDEEKSDASDVRPFLKYYVDKYEYDGLEINILDRSGQIVKQSTAQDWSSFIQHQVVNKEFSSIETYQGNEYTVLRIPIENNYEVYTVEYVKKNDVFHTIYQNSIYTLIIPFLVAMVLSLLVGLFLSRQFVGQIHELVDDVSQIQMKGLMHRLKIKHGKDELNQVRTVFNDLLDQVEDTMDQQKRFIEDTSHELRTPISVFKGHLQMLNRFGKSNPEILDDSLMRMTKEIGHFEHMVQDLLLLSRLEHLQMDVNLPTQNLTVLVKEVTERFSVIDDEIIFDCQCDEICQVKIMPEHFIQLLTIFIDNGLKYTTTSPKKICIQLHQETASVILRIRDFGIGIPEQELMHITKRFFRVDKARSRSMGGVGLGLSIANQIVEKYGFQMAFESTVNEGTTVMITMPEIGRAHV